MASATLAARPGVHPGVFTVSALKNGISVSRYLALLAQVAAWTFLVLSLASFHLADAPSHVVFPHNQAPLNWCGKAGAALAYHAYNLVGLGIWVLVILWGIHLFVSAFVTAVSHAPVRLLGVLLMTVSAAGAQAIVLPHSGPLGDIGGGVLGTVAAEVLGARFGPAGSLVWLAAAFLVGATVAVDIWVILAPLWAFNQAKAVAGPTAEAVGVAATATVKSASWVARMVASLKGTDRGRRPGKPGKKRDEDDRPAGPRKAKPGKRDQAAEAIDERAGGLGGIESFNPDDHVVTSDQDAEDPEPLDEDAGGKRPKKAKPEKAEKTVKSRRGDADEADPENEPDDDNDDARADADEGAPGAGEADGASGLEPGQDGEAGQEDGAPARRTFDPDSLRAKIAKLPLRFAATDRRSATEDDLRDIQNTAELEGYRFPGLDLLEEPETNYPEKMEQFIREQATALEQALKEYRIDGGVVGMDSGPVITLYEVRLAAGTKVAALSAVSSDLARSLKAQNLRIVPNTAGKDTVGIEVPNPHKEKVKLKELMTKSEMFAEMKLPMFLGKDASGNPLIADLTSMPHMLIAGTTGSGKSVCMNSILMSFLYTKKPNELKLVLVDPKMVELSQFKDIPHLMCPVVTEMGKAAAILEWAVRKMDERYELLMEAGVRDIGGYNALSWEELRERFNPADPAEEARIPKKLPFMVFVIDELADLMMTNKEVEQSIVRIAQKARAVGIHLILATQRPQANVVTGLIKSNMPARICFKVASGMDSRIVLDHKGGELLLGQGDMLYLSPRTSKLTRAQGTLVDDKEIRRVAKFMKEVAEPTFERSLMQIRTGSEAAAGLADNGAGGGGGAIDAGDGLSTNDGIAKGQADPLFEKAVEIVLESQKGSVSMLQRRMAIGYTRSSRLIDAMWQAGIVGDHKGTVDRDVLITPDEWAAMKAQAQADAEAAQKKPIIPMPPPTAEELSRAGGDKDAPFDADDDDL